MKKRQCVKGGKKEQETEKSPSACGRPRGEKNTQLEFEMLFLKR